MPIRRCKCHGEIGRPFLQYKKNRNNVQHKENQTISKGNIEGPKKHKHLRQQPVTWFHVLLLCEKTAKHMIFFSLQH